MPTHHKDHWLPKLIGVSAITLGQHIYYRDTAPSASLVREERWHSRQFRRLGIVRFLAQYFGDYLKGRWNGLTHKQAYHAIRLEIEAKARAAAGEEP